MEITTLQYKHCDLISVKGRVDSYTAPKLAEAIEMINKDGRIGVCAEHLIDGQP